MAKKRHTAEQIIHKLREAEVALSKGDSLTKVVRKLGITDLLRLRNRTCPNMTERAPSVKPDPADCRRVGDSLSAVAVVYYFLRSAGEAQISPCPS